ncbi:uncharacterized protein METZ01_LOCUS96296, partial [marine metagenome]
MSTQYITSIGLNYNVWDFNWRVSDCEELVRVTQRRWWGLFYGFILYYSIGILRI